MQDNYNIDNVILDNDQDPKDANVKKVLLIIAAIVLLFLIILVIMKFINSGDIDTDKPLVMPKEENKIDINSSQQDSTKEEFIVSNSPTKKENIESEKGSMITNNTPTIQVYQPELNHEKIKNSLKEVEKPQNIVKKDDQKVESETVKKVEDTKSNIVVEKKVEPTPIKTQIIAPKTNKSQKNSPHIKKEATKKQNIDLLKNKPSSKNELSNTYIQVLATTNFKDDDAQVKKLKAANYKIHLYKTNIKGVEYTKVLVGPYSGEELQKELAKIRASINKEAFVYKK